MTEKEVIEAVELLETRRAFDLSPEEFGEVVADSVWKVMKEAGKAYVEKRLAELKIEVEPAVSAKPKPPPSRND